MILAQLAYHPHPESNISVLTELDITMANLSSSNVRLCWKCTGKIADAWKKANMVPVLKKGTENVWTFSG